MAEYNSVDAAFDALNDAVDHVTTNVIPSKFEEIAIQVVADAKRLCSVDQGQLRADIQYDIEEKNNFIDAKVGNTLEYAPYVHQGTGIYAVEGNGRKTPWMYEVHGSSKYKGVHITRGQKPQPYLQKAMEKVKSTLADDLAAAIKGGLLR